MVREFAIGRAMARCQEDVGVCDLLPEEEEGRVPKWGERRYTPYIFERVRKSCGISGLEIFQFWECARDSFCWGCRRGLPGILAVLFEEVGRHRGVYHVVTGLSMGI